MMLEKFEQTEKHYQELETLLADPHIISDRVRYQKLVKEFSDMTPLVAVLREYRQVLKQSDELKKILIERHEKDFEDLAKDELKDLEERQEKLLQEIKDLSNPKRNEKEKNIIFEIRAGTGGEEASLFAGDLYRMYTKYAVFQGWKVELMSSHPSDTGGFKEVIFGISGPGASKRLKWESGAHRVQRVPTTEASGRIHTSAATVAVLFEPEEIELKIEPKDLKIDVFRSSGPGGQSVNTTDSAIRLTHLPTGIVVACQDERSQLKNRLKAMRVLRARLLDKAKQDHLEKTAQDRKQKIGSGDRSEKIRTYNFSDHRITDHRIGFSTYQLPNVLDGDMDELTDALMKAEEEGLLK